MPKDRDQLTPDEPEDAGLLRPRRSAAREATGSEEPAGEAGHGAASGGTEPTAAETVTESEKSKYK